MVELGFRLQVFQGRAGLEALAADWRALVDALSRRSYVQLWEWHRSSLEADDCEGNEVYFGALYDDEGLFAIIPLECKTKRSLAGLNLHVDVRVAGFREAVVGFGHGDILLHPRAQLRFNLASALEAFRSRVPRPWEVTELGPALEDSTVTQVIEASRQTGRLSEVRISQTVGVSNGLKTGKYEDFLGQLSKNFRDGLRKSRNKMAKLEDVTIEWACTPEALEAAFPRFLDVEASGWKGKAGSAISLNPAIRKFYAELTRLLAPSARCRINLMMHGTKTIAGHFGILLDDRYYLLKIGYDETYRQEGPGNLLLENLLKRLAEDSSVKYVDLITDTPWHQSWKPLHRSVQVRYVFHNKALGVVVWAGLRGKDLLRPLVRTLRLRLSHIARRPAASA